MMKVFLDTNILLDYGQVRDDFTYAKAILELGERGEMELCASYLSYANMGYILRNYSRKELWELITDMREGITQSCKQTLQYQCAIQSGCELIVTNNKRDFREFCELPVYTSKEFLLYYFRLKDFKG